MTTTATTTITARPAQVSRRRLWMALAIIVAFLVVEIIGGLITGSLALLADAGHMLTDALALALAIFVAPSGPSGPRRRNGPSASFARR